MPENQQTVKRRWEMIRTEKLKKKKKNRKAGTTRKQEKQKNK
jgi:hypothetical protein